MMSVRPTWGVTVSGVNGLWEHGTFDLLAGGNQPGGRVEAEIGYGLPAFGTAGVLTPYAGASLTDAGGRRRGRSRPFLAGLQPLPQHGHSRLTTR